MMKSTDYQFLPFGGGLLDQPEWLMEDIVTLASLHSQIEKMLDRGSKG
jgi:hypothetical protein